MASTELLDNADALGLCVTVGYTIAVLLPGQKETEKA